jgi:hypothetical protein
LWRLVARTGNRLVGIRYRGFDVVESVIAANTKRFSSSTVTFHLLRGMAELPNADLVICKDMLQHVPNADVATHLDLLLHQYKFAIITNNISCTRDGRAEDNTNLDIPLGAYPTVAARPTSVQSQGSLALAMAGYGSTLQMGQERLPIDGMTYKSLPQRSVQPRVTI